MMHINLSEISEIFSSNWFYSAKKPALGWFRRKDHLGDPSLPLDLAVRDLVYKNCGQRPSGKITLLTHLRYFGFSMNPVSFYYCWDSEGKSVNHIVAEVNNTPWGEQYCYVMNCSFDKSSDMQKFEFNKNFHVSPFMKMDQKYHWQFSIPSDFINVNMSTDENEKLIFSAALNLKSIEMTNKNLNLFLIRYPFMTFKVFCAIYWQAFRLWIKGVPFIAHPNSKKGEQIEW